MTEIERTLDVLVSKFTDELNAGQKPSISKYLNKCPAEKRDELSELLQFITNVKPYFQAKRQAELDRLYASLASVMPSSMDKSVIPLQNNVSMNPAFSAIFRKDGTLTPDEESKVNAAIQKALAEEEED